jgi:hypothetical protein
MKFFKINYKFSLNRCFGELVRFPVVLKARINEVKVTAQFNQELSEKTLKKLLYNDFFDRIPNLRQRKNEINKSEFVLLMLQMMKKVEDKDILLALQLFQRIDSAKQGVLNKEVKMCFDYLFVVTYIFEFILFVFQNMEIELEKARSRDRAKTEFVIF